ncbi:hypothetical protein Tco_0089631 [Tanacetum coccineum]
MEDEHLNTIPATELDEVIKSSVENLVQIPCESEGISNNMCDVPLCNNPTPLEAFKEHSETIINSNNDYSSSNDDYPYGEDIGYVDASPPDAEINAILREKLLNVNLLIANIEALKDNPTPSSDIVTKSSSTSLNLFLEETNTVDNSLTESETFFFDLEENSSAVPLFLLIILFRIMKRTIADELAHKSYLHQRMIGIYLKNGARAGNLTMDVVEDIFPNKRTKSSSA